MMNEYSMEEILPVLATRASKYTSNESTSVSYDVARQLMGSILYCIEANGKDVSTEILDSTNKMPADAAFQIGLAKRKEKISKAKNLYETIRHSFCSYQNECYYDTVIKGMPAFFLRYDVEFDATNHILTLDYPLIYPVTDQTGIDIIHEYLIRTQIEQRFLNHFSTDSIEMILNGYDKNHAELIINICKLVLRNAIGCMLVGKSVYKLSISDEDRKKLKAIGENQPLSELERILSSALDRIIEEEFESNLNLADYLKQDIKEFAYEYKTYCELNKLNRIFLGNRTVKSQNETIFEDGVLMDDEALRSLIDKISGMRLLSDKLELVKNQIKSLADLKEVLIECFFGDEYEEVFRLLSNEEIMILQTEIATKSEYDDNLDEWETALIRFIKNRIKS